MRIKVVVVGVIRHGLFERGESKRTFRPRQSNELVFYTGLYCR